MSLEQDETARTRYATDLDAGVRAAFGRQPAALPGWSYQPTEGMPHSYHVSPSATSGLRHGFGLITDAADGIVEVVVLLGILRPQAPVEAVLRTINSIHEEVPTGRFLLAGEPARLLFETELVLGEANDRAALVERLLPVLLRQAAATITEELPSLAPFLSEER